MPQTYSVPLNGIDGHAHVFERRLELAETRRYAPGYDATLADYLAQLDRHGLSHGVLVQPSFLGTDNSYLLEALAQAPERLRGVVVVDPDTPVQELQRMAALGVRGVRLNLVGRELIDLGEARWQGFFKVLKSLGWHVELHRQIEDIAQLIKPLLAAGCKVVIDHFGRADARLGLDQPGFAQLLTLGREGNVWVKVSAMYRLGGSVGEQQGFAGRALAALAEHLGANRLLWGSDWPHTQHEQQMSFTRSLEGMQRIASDAGILSPVFRDSAAELFGID
ncbi:amidohydrolase family protein [Pseudomonas sp. 3A(2025)]